MADLRLRTAAEADLQEILDYSIDRFGIQAAEAYLRSVERSFDLLRRHPEARAFRADLTPPVRCLSHRSHRIFYDVHDEIVWVVRVLHHSMDEHRRLSE